jgi:hypothetical protein
MTKLSRLVDGIGRMSPKAVTVVIEDEIEVIAWLQKRNIAAEYIIIDADTMNYCKQKGIDQALPISHPGDDKIIRASGLHSDEIWHSSRMSQGVRIEYINKINIKQY